MAQNSSGKRGNAPQVAVVIGVVLILIGAWNLVNVLVPAAAISSLINFIRHLWNVVWPCGLLAAGGYLLWATKSGKLSGFAQPGNHEAFRRSRADKRIFVEAYALQGVAIEIAIEIRERRGIAVNDAHVAVALGKQRCKLRANTPAANDDDIRHTPAFRPTPRSTAR